MTVGLRERIARDAFAFVPAAEMAPLVGVDRDSPGWSEFAASWNDLPLDAQLPGGHRYRRRRHATLSARAGDAAFRIEAHQPHYQSLDYNPLVGGIERRFEPIRPGTLAGPTVGRGPRLCLWLFGRPRPSAGS